MGTVTVLMVIDVGGCFVNVKFGLVVVAAEYTPPVVLLAVKTGSRAISVVFVFVFVCL